MPDEPKTQSDADVDAGDDSDPKSGTGKKPRHKRIEDQRDRAYGAIDSILDRNDRLASSVEKLVEVMASNNQAHAPTKVGSLDPWENFSDEQLQGLIHGGETDEHTKNEALLRLINRGVDTQVKNVRDEIKGEMKTNFDARERRSNVQRTVQSKYGPEIYDANTELGNLRESIYKKFQDRYSEEDVASRPEYELLAAQLAAEHLGGPPGSAEKESDVSPTKTPLLPSDTPSKSGPPPEALLEGAGEAFAEKISRAKEALDKKDNKGAVRDMVAGLWPELSR